MRHSLWRLQEWERTASKREKWQALPTERTGFPSFCSSYFSQMFDSLTQKAGKISIKLAVLPVQQSVLNKSQCVQLPLASNQPNHETTFTASSMEMSTKHHATSAGVDGETRPSRNSVRFTPKFVGFMGVFTCYYQAWSMPEELLRLSVSVCVCVCVCVCVPTCAHMCVIWRL